MCVISRAHVCDQPCGCCAHVCDQPCECVQECEADLGADVNGLDLFMCDGAFTFVKKVPTNSSEALDFEAAELFGHGHGHHAHHMGKHGFSFTKCEGAATSVEAVVKATEEQDGSVGKGGNAVSNVFACTGMLRSIVTPAEGAPSLPTVRLLCTDNGSTGKVWQPLKIT